MKKAFINQLWALWEAKAAWTCMEQFAAMAEALMADQHVRFDGEVQREWFYETINKNARNPYRNFFAAAFVVLRFENIGLAV